MEIKLLKSGEVAVISLSGCLEIEKAQSFKKACLENFKDKKIIFCMRSLSFVGSSGIQSFFNILNELNETKKMSVKVAGLNSDFQRIYNFTECSSLEVHESVEVALMSF